MQQELTQLKQELYDLFKEKARSACLCSKTYKNYASLSNDRGRLIATPSTISASVVLKDFFKHKIIPEIDAYCFSKLASKGITDIDYYQIPEGYTFFVSRTIGNVSLGKLIVVPTTYFNTEIRLNDGITEGQDNGGFTKIGKDISVLGVNTSYVHSVVNIELEEIEPQKDIKGCDYWLSFRVFYDIFIDKNSKIYVSAY